MAVTYPHLKVTLPEGSEGRAVFAKVELDGKMIPATRVAFDTGADLSGFVTIRLEFTGTLDFESDVPLALTGVEEA